MRLTHVVEFKYTMRKSRSIGRKIEMKKYGETLRKIREQKGHTMQRLAEGILSVSFLSKFERGESDISLIYMTQLLERLSFSFDEFFYLHDGYESDQLESFFDKADKAYVNRNLKQLKQLRELALEKWEKHGLETFRYNTLMLDVYESIISNEEVAGNDETLDLLYAYLFDVEVWGYYEMRLYNSTMFFMPPERVMTLSKTAYEKSTRIGKFKKMDKVIIPILINTLTYLMGRSPSYEKQYKVFLSYLESMDIPEADLYIRNSLLQIKGIHELKNGDPEKGVAMVHNAISIFNELGAKELTVTAENYLAFVLDEKNNHHFL